MSEDYYPPYDDLPPMMDIDDEYERRVQFHRDVQEEATRLRVRQAARELIEGEGSHGTASINPPGDVEDVRRRFPRLDLATLLRADRPPREWVIEGLVPAGAAVSLVAPAGVGKSLLTLAASLHIAAGRTNFAGLRIPRQRRVLLVDLENTEDDLAERLAALGVTPETAATLDQLVPIHLPPLAPLDSASGGAEILAMIAAYDVGRGDVVVLDSFQRVVKGKENDSDTYRDFYRHTGVHLKRLGVTVLRTDNTGKDADRGARGSSGKRDDVDLELILTRDAERPSQLRITPGKSRLMGIRPALLQMSTSDAGRLHYSTAMDPFRTAVLQAIQTLEGLGIPPVFGEPNTLKRLKSAGVTIPRATLRQAMSERRRDLADSSGEVLSNDLADDQWRAPASTSANPTNALVKSTNDLADHPRRAPGEAPPDTSPPLALSIESGEVGEQTPCEACGGSVSDIRTAYGKTTCLNCESAREAS